IANRGRVVISGKGASPMSSTRRAIALLFLVSALTVSWALTSGRTSAQPSGYRAGRTADGKPNLNGIWQAMNTANWDLQDHDARPGPAALGAAFSVPAGDGVVDGNVIPYKPEALAKKKQNMAASVTLDPEIKCYLPGVPRATYQPFPFVRVRQTPS
ncbi:MAG TPA: hypothetical protein VKB50_22170, partial [Vicinamibacterales bacterium]|nr:hypothetical protein [Vicinamibacterales bacterium]